MVSSHVQKAFIRIRQAGSAFKRLFPVFALLAFMPVILSCAAQVDVPNARNASIPSPTMAEKRPQAVNEKPDSVLYLPLGSDVLVPETLQGGALPDEIVGPFELRSETLAGAMQLILADYEIPLAFETDEGLTRTITVANLRGPLDEVVDRVCSLADLYCSFENGMMIVKETQTFTVTVPPVGGDTDIISALATGLQAITGQAPITESGTRTIIYEATNRTAKLAERYFQRIRANTALIVFEIYIWEVALNTLNDAGINWEALETFGKFEVGLRLPGGVSESSPVSIGLPTTEGVAFGAGDILEFISDYGAVKTISQPQITVLSGAQATLRAARTQNFVSSLTRSVDNGEVSVSTETDSVDTGFTITISSNWDNATIYGDIEIELQEFLRFEEFETEGGTLRLPETTERELSSQIRIRPGDSLLIAGLVRENDQYDTSGPGFEEPFFPTSRRATVGNSELVFLLKPRVIVFTSEADQQRFSGVQGPSGAPVSSVFEPVQAQSQNSFPSGSLSPDLLDPGQ